MRTLTLNTVCLTLVVSLVIACGGSEESQTDYSQSDVGSTPDSSDFGVRDGSDAELGPDEGRTDVRAEVECGSSGAFYVQNDLELLVGCERLKGRLQIIDYFETDVAEVNSLTHVDEGLILVHAPSLKDLSDFQQLETVGQTLMLAEILQIPTTDGLPNLKAVEGRVILRNLPLDDLHFPELETVGGLDVIDMPNVTSLDGLAKLQLIDGDLDISIPGVDEVELEAFLQRVEVSGTIRLNGEFFSN